MANWHRGFCERFTKIDTLGFTGVYWAILGCVCTYIHTYIPTYIHTYRQTDMTWHDMTWHDMTLHYITLHYIHTYMVPCPVFPPPMGWGGMIPLWMYVCMYAWMYVSRCVCIRIYRHIYILCKYVCKHVCDKGVFSLNLCAHACVHLYMLHWNHHTVIVLTINST